MDYRVLLWNPPGGGIASWSWQLSRRDGGLKSPRWQQGADDVRAAVVPARGHTRCRPGPDGRAERGRGRDVRHGEADPAGRHLLDRARPGLAGRGRRADGAADAGGRLGAALALDVHPDGHRTAADG